MSEKQEASPDNRWQEWYLAHGPQSSSYHPAPYTERPLATVDPRGEIEYGDGRVVRLGWFPWGPSYRDLTRTEER